MEQMLDEANMAQDFAIKILNKDFVATNKEFIELVDLILKEGFGVVERDDLLNKIVSGKTIQEHITNKIATIGENISLRRVMCLTGANVYSYVHNSVSNDCGKIGVLVSLKGKKDDDFGKKLAMHIAATAPLAMSEKDIAEDIVNREKKIIWRYIKNSRSMAVFLFTNFQ